MIEITEEEINKTTDVESLRLLAIALLANRNVLLDKLAEQYKE